jgi:hypothetical protein
MKRHRGEVPDVEVIETHHTSRRAFIAPAPERQRRLEDLRASIVRRSRTVSAVGAVGAVGAVDGEGLEELVAVVTATASTGRDGVSSLGLRLYDIELVPADSHLLMRGEGIRLESHDTVTERVVVGRFEELFTVHGQRELSGAGGVVDT